MVLETKKKCEEVGGEWREEPFMICLTEDRVEFGVDKLNCECFEFSTWKGQRRAGLKGQSRGKRCFCDISENGEIVGQATIDSIKQKEI